MANTNMKVVTARAPVNIAVIKYWGKQDESLILPLNDSISGTLSIEHLCATTTVAISPTFERDRLWLNGVEVDINANKRMVNCIAEIRKRSSLPYSSQHIHICSQNNFPTAAGLASSAAGFACLVFATGKLLGLEDLTQLSTLARIGSGSACRSLFSGFVQWVKGVDSETSIGRQIVDERHWPEMRVMILVVEDKQKETGSTVGMQQSVATSRLLAHRAEQLVGKSIEQMTQVIVNKDFQQFAEITMRDSNQFHAICQDTWPPIRYMNDISWSIVSFCHKYNTYYQENRVAYTFDAGPNACIYLLEESVQEVVNLVKILFSPSGESQASVIGGGDNDAFIKGIPVADVTIDDKLLSYFNASVGNKPSGGIRYVINTCIGCGPNVVEDVDERLLDELGMPK